MGKKLCYGKKKQTIKSSKLQHTTAHLESSTLGI